ncbi:DUF6517 family protein [Natronosalvus amylolyticus]|uniref:DUF6517 family protein n=1 Tax=Natronosalvus amylolyticus TaxID=2961994 RepID=UPI0020C9B548|nr:DUF6517 family protein [Natronosalvus amylolyticus]
MMDRRTALAAGCTGLVSATAGCIGFVLGDESLEYIAEPILPSEPALERTGYELSDQGWLGIGETIGERDIGAAAWSGTYTNDVTIQGQSQEAAIFACLSMPKIEVAGSPINPFADMTPRELLEEFGDEVDSEFDDIAQPQPTGDSFSLPMLGEARIIEEFISETRIQGEPIELLLWITTFTHRDDVIIVFGGFPRQLADEGVLIEDLMESVEHPPEGDRGIPEANTDEGIDDGL